MLDPGVFSPGERRGDPVPSPKPRKVRPEKRITFTVGGGVWYRAPGTSCRVNITRRDENTVWFAIDTGMGGEHHITLNNRASVTFEQVYVSPRKVILVECFRLSGATSHLVFACMR